MMAPMKRMLNSFMPNPNKNHPAVKEKEAAPGTVETPETTAMAGIPKTEEEGDGKKPIDTTKSEPNESDRIPEEADGAGH